MKPDKPISKAIIELKANLSEIGRVCEWANHMGYENPKKFSRYFLRYYNVRPQKAIDCIRLFSIIEKLRSLEEVSNYKIARLHSIPNEKALNKFMNYHLGCSPSKIKSMPENILNKKMENLESILQEHT